MSHGLCRRAAHAASAAVVVLRGRVRRARVPAPPAMAAAPSNDLIENATVIDPLPFTATVSTAEAT